MNLAQCLTSEYKYRPVEPLPIRPGPILRRIVVPARERTLYYKNGHPERVPHVTTKKLDSARKDATMVAKIHAAFKAHPGGLTAVEMRDLLPAQKEYAAMKLSKMLDAGEVVVAPGYRLVNKKKLRIYQLAPY